MKLNLTFLDFLNEAMELSILNIDKPFVLDVQIQGKTQRLIDKQPFNLLKGILHDAIPEYNTRISEDRKEFIINSYMTWIRRGMKDRSEIGRLLDDDDELIIAGLELTLTKLTDYMTYETDAYFDISWPVNSLYKGTHDEFVEIIKSSFQNKLGTNDFSKYYVIDIANAEIGFSETCVDFIANLSPTDFEKAKKSWSYDVIAKKRHGLCQYPMHHLLKEKKE